MTETKAVEETFEHAPGCGGCDGEWVDCWRCGGAAEFDGYEEDPLWYEPGETYPCDECKGAGGWLVCWAWPRGES